MYSPFVDHSVNTEYKKWEIAFLYATSIIENENSAAGHSSTFLCLLATLETEVGGSLEPRSLRPAWAT
jgi:hypothetical protein